MANPNYNPKDRDDDGGLRDLGTSMRERALGTGRQREVLFLFTLVLLCFVLFFLFLGNRPLWDVDEGMHAATSKDMILSGDWITPQLNGESFYDKPVFFNCLNAPEVNSVSGQQALRIPPAAPYADTSEELVE